MLKFFIPNVQFEFKKTTKDSIIKSIFQSAIKTQKWKLKSIYCNLTQHDKYKTFFEWERKHLFFGNMF